MSWMKRPKGSPGPIPGTGPPPFNPNQQPVGGMAMPAGQQQPYQNYQPSQTEQNPNQQYWHPQQPSIQPQSYAQPQPQYNQPTYQPQDPQQQNYPANQNVNSYYNQGYVNQEPMHNQNQQQQAAPVGYQQNYVPQPRYNQYNNQPIPVQQEHTQQFQATNQGKENWGDDSWDWGWDENAARQQQQMAHQQNPQHMLLQQSQPVQPQVQKSNGTNANVLAESFGGTNSWNWSAGESQKPEVKQLEPPVSVPPTQTVSTIETALENSEPRFVSFSNLQVDSSNAAPTVDHTPIKNTVDLLNQNTHSLQHPLQNHDQDVKTLSDLDTLKEHNLPNLALGKRFKSDTLTPQWSIESQMSQESSDGPLTHSESTYPSNPSRNSSKSSPGPSADNTNFNYGQQVQNSIEEPTLDSAWSQQYDNPFIPTSDEYIDSAKLPQDLNPNKDIADSFKDMNISNKENPTPDIIPSVDSLINTSAPPFSCNNKSATSIAPPPSVTSSKNATPPPIGLPPINITGSTNPFKRAGPLSHKTGIKAQPLGPHPGQSISPQSQQDGPRRDSIPKPTNLTAPLSVNNTGHQGNRPSPSYPTANLETTPDNSERPDQPQVPSFRSPHLPSPAAQNPVENLEVAPRNDRNEYLQTGHLTETDYGENTNFTRNDPPPGLRRMVLGQQEPELLPSSLPADEPPPGLSRMVTGQLTDVENIYPQGADDYLERQIDGQTTDNADSRNQSYRQADGQQTPEPPNIYSQPITSRGNDRLPGIGLDRMVPGESNDYRSVQQFSNAPYSNTSDQRVVTGLEHDYLPPQLNTNDSQAPEVREQNVDGSDFSENVPRSQPRGSFPSAAESSDQMQRNLDLVNYGDIQGRSTPAEPNDIREVVMEGENLQDLSMITPNEIQPIREQRLDGGPTTSERKVELSDSTMERPTSNSRSQMNRDKNTSGDDSERDRAFKSSPRRERRERKTSKDKDGYDRKEREGDRKTLVRERDDKRSDRGRRGEERYGDDRDDRRPRRSNRDKRYETEDTDYYSDKEREKRRHREGSYTAASKPPRPDDKDKRYRDDRDRSRRYATIERDRRYLNDYESERDEANISRRDDRDRNMTLPRRNDRDSRYDDRDRRYDERDKRYGDKKYSSLRREKDGDRKRGDPYSSPSRPDSRDPDPEEEDLDDTVDSRRGRSDRERERRRHRRDRDRQYDPYYDRYGPGPAPGPTPGYQDPYVLHQQQQQTYQYYENLRLTNPRAYMEVYNKVMAGQPLPPPSASALAAANLDILGSSSTSFVQGYPTLINSALPEDRASVHSGRSSANALSKGNLDESYYYGYRRIEPGRSAAPYQGRTGASSIRTEFSGSRDFNTDASLNLQLEESTVRSERMTPVKYVKPHIKGNISSTNLVTVNPSYPGEGLPATVEIWNLNSVLKTDPVRCELTNFPGPLIKGVTHKKTIIAYCESKIQAAVDNNSLAPVCHRPPSLLSGSSGSVPVLPVDLASYVLMWDLLILLLRQNGMVIGTDIAELLMKNKREYEHNSSQPSSTHTKLNCGSRRNSAASSASTSCSATQLPHEELSSPAKQQQQDNNPEKPGDEHTTWNEPSIGADPSQSSLPRRPDKLALKDQEKDNLDKFREFLLFGNLKEALEWAMSRGLWGHALQLCAGLPDRRTRAAVAARFVAALSPADPLHTLYALMAARQPPASTCVSDEKWGDWRPHLSMILSNTSQRPEVDKRAITTLGDTLMNRGNIYAAHFCYVMARVDFGRHGNQPFCLPSADQSQARLVLLGANHATEPDFSRFCNNNERIAATEVYEYACSLSEPTVLLEFQVYKYLLATRLTDYGLYERALSYMEQLSKIMSATPQLYAPALLRNVLELAERLKYHDPSQQDGGALPEDETDSPQGSPRREQEWLSQLRNVVQQIDNGLLPVQREDEVYLFQQPTPTHQTVQPQWYQHQMHSQTQYQQPTSNEMVQTESAVEHQSQYEQQTYVAGGADPTQPPAMFHPQQFHAQTQPEQSYLDLPHNPEVGLSTLEPPSEDSQYGSQDTHYGGQDNQYAGQNTQYGGHTTDGGYWNQDKPYNYLGHNEPEKERDADTTQQTDTGDAYEAGRPQISMPNSTGGKSALFDDYETDGRKNSQSENSKNNSVKPKSSDTNTIGAAKPQKSWFGGIFDKFKAKNQMILPDDKNPTIVWDADRKRWKNLDGDEDENDAALPPPPKMADIASKITNTMSPAGPGGPRPPSPGATPPISNSNIFKMQKSRHIKKSYVDVFNPSGASIRPLPPPSEVLGPAQSQQSAPNFFVPETQKEGQAPSMYDPNYYNTGS